MLCMGHAVAMNLLCLTSSVTVEVSAKVSHRRPTLRAATLAVTLQDLRLRGDAAVHCLMAWHGQKRCLKAICMQGAWCVEGKHHILQQSSQLVCLCLPCQSDNHAGSACRKTYLICLFVKATHTKQHAASSMNKRGADSQPQGGGATSVPVSVWICMQLCSVKDRHCNVC